MKKQIRFKNSLWVTTLTLAGLGLLYSCTTWRRSESIQAKMDRYKAQEDFVYPTLKLVLEHEDIQEGHKHSNRAQRFPASLPQRDTKSQKEYAVLKKSLPTLSTKQLYFTTLYSQYVDLKGALEEDGVKGLLPINACPQLHTTFLDHKKWIGKKQFSRPVRLNLTSFQGGISLVEINTSTLKRIFPEYFMPLPPEVDKRSGSPQLIHQYFTQGHPQNRPQVLRKGLVHYATNMQKEITHLCEKGATPYSYLFENYLQMIPNDDIQAEASRKAFQINLLTSMLLKSSLDSNSQSFAPNPYEGELLSRLPKWIGGYLHQQKKSRLRFLAKNTPSSQKPTPAPNRTPAASRLKDSQ